MAYDEDLTQRFRQALGASDHISEKRMMGGVCFLYQGNMVGGADRQKSGQGRFMFRVGKDNEDAALGLGKGIPMQQGGRHMRGFYFVNEEDGSEKNLKAWANLAMSFVKTLPAK